MEDQVPGCCFRKWPIKHLIILLKSEGTCLDYIDAILPFFP